MNIKNFQTSLDYLVKAELTPFIWGRAGIGKSSVVKQYAQSKGYHFFPFYLGTQSDIGDILGLADFKRDKDGTAVATKFATPEWLKNAIDYCNENPDSGAIIFLDEFNRARRDILNGMFSLALDKTFHTLKLPKNCHVIAAGNPPTDEYFVTDVNETALMARFVHIKLDPTFDEWLEYANTISMDSTLIGFLRGQPQLLEQQSTDFQLPVKVDRRAFERLDKLFKLNTPHNLLNELMPGIIGLERTVAYMNYLKEVESPLSGPDIFNKSRIEILKTWCNENNIMASYLNLSCENLEKHFADIEESNSMLTETEKENLIEFLFLIPKDISYPVIRRLVDSRNKVFTNFYLSKDYEIRLVTLINLLRNTKDQK